MEVIKPTQRHNNELTVVSSGFNFEGPSYDPQAFAVALSEKMIEENGVGLSAVQVGIPDRIFVIRTDPVYVCFNPKIVDVGLGETVHNEGCLSFPGMIVKIKRPDIVRLRFQHVDGKFITRKFEGLAARVVLHEMDHLDGILFYNRASRFHRDRALKDWEISLKRARVKTAGENAHVSS